MLHKLEQEISESVSRETVVPASVFESDDNVITTH